MAWHVRHPDRQHVRPPSSIALSAVVGFVSGLRHPDFPVLGIVECDCVGAILRHRSWHDDRGPIASVPDQSDFGDLAGPLRLRGRSYQITVDPVQFSDLVLAY